ncbi:type VII secretion-associated serine protease mycosin [Catellatospora sichuanensis]|uniref:type VII secretion-associated serine protease mycosin n=1 Tax=Catellatospora sichuanensis TaxID=1969805 RepID=UPI0011844207|nr:type VII secretion-associated serine protease mycosin [Catellatospora sichuanensis]
MYRSRPTVAFAARTVAFSVVFSFGVVGIATAPAAAAPCPSGNRAASEVIAAKPWPQQRWDLSALPRGIDGSGVIVAVLDSGVDKDHPQLRGQVVPGRDMLPGGGTDGRQDCVGHGTGVASVIAAKPLAGVEFRGLAPGVQILPIRVSEQLGGQENSSSARQADVKDMATAVRYAVSKDADVINLSLSYGDTAPNKLAEFREAIREAVAADVVVIAAVGNAKQKGNPTPYPASWDNVLGVGAIDEAGQRLQASQTGPYVDLVAPGDQVTVARPGRGHGKESGTSFAAPMVAATAALVRQAYPKLTESQVRKRLSATADPAPGGRLSDDYGVGILNPVRAVTDVLDGATRVTPAALAPRAADPAAEAAADRAAQQRSQALWLAGLGAILAGLVLALAVALPNGIRRRWRAAGN